MVPQFLVSPYLILCEGSNDESFFTGLLKNRNIKGFQVAFPADPEQRSGGRNGFGDLLGSLTLQSGFSNLKTIVLASDNDDNGAKSFKFIQRQIKEAGEYSVPKKPFLITRTRGYPSLAVLMLPWKQELGNLETLCLRAAIDKWPKVASCLKDYYRCSDAPNWTLTKRSKMKLRCLIAATCKDDPNTSLTHLWSRKEEYHIPLDHECFDRIVKFLKDLNV